MHKIRLLGSLSYAVADSEQCMPLQANIQKTNTFPLHIEIQNNISCLQQYNNFMKHISFQFNYCCVCNEKTFMKELTICSILDLNTKLKNMTILFKMNPKHHLLN